MLLCDDQYIPEVYVSAVEKVSAKPGHVIVPTVQPIYQTFLQQLAAQISSVGGSNNVLGSIPTTDPSFDQIVNPIIPEDQTIDEVVTEPYNEDDRSILEYNPHSEYGLDDFDEDYIGHSGSREGVNDEPAPHHGIVSGRSLKPKETMTDMQVELDLGLNYTKAWKAKEHAENNVFGPIDISYQLLPAYCHELKHVNPGTVTTIKTNNAHKFEYLFIAFCASLNGVPRCKQSDVPSSLCPAIKVAMAKEYPEITHGLCGFHMNINLKNIFKIQVVCNLFYEASRAYRESEFLEKI
ncbi:hypothetical protein QYF36_020054 [Acer negundo]|nr:hypothetical protein QYF36_020054 [Acer negundo]